MTAEAAPFVDAANVSLPEAGDPWYHLFCPRPIVRILFYTDYPDVNFNVNQPDFGVGTLRDLVLSHNTFNATFSIDLINRHDGGHAQHKLTSAMLADYDQVWFFGVLQCNLPGQPENELTDPEADALRDWMGHSGRQGGVLITGDHSNPRPFNADPGLNPLLNLGRALGRRIPRAGQLRVWEGLPSSDFSILTNTHDTQVPDGMGTDLNDLTLQDDAFPQHLLLTKYFLGWGWPFWVRRYRPHPLFCGRKGPIEVFPDHMHEGALAFPGSYPASEWPSGSFGQPTPQVVARGTDKRFAATYDLVSAYDGWMASVGRIVADSTWHHYFHVNLSGFGPGPVLDAIADYYVNLAVWLSPPDKRAQMRCWFWWYTSLHPAVRMVSGASLAVLGLTAIDVLGRYASQCTISDMVWPFPLPLELRERFPWPPEELAIGGVVREYHNALDATAAGEPDLPSQASLVGSGLRAAAAEHHSELARAASAAGELDQVIAELLREGDTERER
jgi:hypothetical protein